MNDEVKIKTFKNIYKESWIKELSEDYWKMINSYRSIANPTFFHDPGNIYGKNDRTLQPDISNYFNRLLFSPNIAVLDYVISNIKDFENFRFVDNGAGFGLLSVFLKKIGIECINYDNYDQLGPLDTKPDVSSKDVSMFYSKYGISPAQRDLFSNNAQNCKVMTSCGIWADNKDFNSMNLEFMLLDNGYFGWKGTNYYANIDFKNFDKVKSYPGLIDVFKRKK